METQAVNGPVVVDVTDADFMQKVVEESKRRPVLVDFWADWCGPCKMLSPVLERIAEEKAGQFLLAKVDVDADRYVSSQFRVTSIPNVWAFVDGKPVDQFIGALPEQAVRQFIDRLLPTEADLEAEEAFEAAEAGNVEDAEARFREVLAEDEGNRVARLGLARVLMGRGELEEAAESVKPLLPDPDAERLLAAIRVAEWEGTDGSDPLAGPKRLAAEGKWREALDGFLGAVCYAPDARDHAREAMLDVFAVLGDDDPLTREFRPKLAAALF